MKGLGTLLISVLTLVVAGKSAESFLARQAEVEASPAELRTQQRLGPAAGEASKLAPSSTTTAPPQEGDPVVYVSWRGTRYHLRTCQAV
ncbi:MAG: hypothetical protein O3A20_02605 [Planctomycetota bacterium]|nr:hypothetical protein [Planctomycetota bacterium]